VHQFCHIGAHSMTSMFSYLTKDVPAYTMLSGRPAEPRGINAEGLKRRGYTPEAIAGIKRAYKTLFKSGLTLAAARAELAAQAAQTPEVRTLLEFLGTSTRGLLR
jgi:UDP-N-acetylglucosamine acyltransferase